MLKTFNIMRTDKEVMSRIETYKKNLSLAESEPDSKQAAFFIKIAIVELYWILGEEL